MDERALVIGATGLVGTCLMRSLRQARYQAIGTFCKRDLPGGLRLDLADPESVHAVIGATRPRLVFLAGGFVSVEGAERDPLTAEGINVRGTEAAAQAVRSVGGRMIFFSTDYIFDGQQGPYGEDAAPAPLNVYGRNKLAAEGIVREALGDDGLIVRTTTVFGWDRSSPNFAMQVWKTIGSGQPLRVPSDQRATPTLATYLSDVTVRLAQSGQGGVVNVAGADLVTRGDLACAIAGSLGLDRGLLRPAPTATLGLLARRPLQGGLRTHRLKQLLGMDAMGLAEACERLRAAWRQDVA